MDISVSPPPQGPDTKKPDTKKPDTKKKAFFSHLYVQVIVAIILGGLVGYYYPNMADPLKTLGDGFIKLIKMIIAPVIFLTLVTGIVGMSDLKTMGKISLKVFGYFFVVSSLALVIGLIVANLIQPGQGMNINPLSLKTDKIAQFATKAHETTLSGFVLDIIPDTLVSALTGNNILQVLLVSVLFGIGLILIGDKARPVIEVLTSTRQAVFKVVNILMKAAPIGAFGAFAFTIGKFGLSAITHLASLVFSFYATSLLFVLIVLGLIGLFTGFSILKLLTYLKTELLLVLGTSSSESALPSLIEKMEAAGCQRSIVGLVVPLGYSFNLDGTNIYMTLAALFIAQATNTPLSFEQQALLIGVAILSSKGAAGVSGSGFITLAATLSVVPSIPIGAMALILGVDRFMSECRSLTNFVGNAVATVVISHWEGALDKEKLKAALNPIKSLV